MQAVEAIINRIMESRKETGQDSCTREVALTVEDNVCPKCKGTGLIFIDDTTVKICECQELERCKRMLEKSGISESYRKLRFENYNPYSEQTKEAKAMAEEYASSFIQIECSRKNSISLLGQVGAGKTHLSIAIANELYDAGIGVLYMPYRSAITELKQLVGSDEERYQSLIEGYKKARVLLIDDFAKGKVTEADVNAMFDIINDRYLNNKPIILSSEKDPDGLLEFDEATGSRIIEMSKGHITVFQGQQCNYRLR